MVRVSTSVHHTCLDTKLCCFINTTKKSRIRNDIREFYLCFSKLFQSILNYENWSLSRYIYGYQTLWIWYKHYGFLNLWCPGAILRNGNILFIVYQTSWFAWSMKTMKIGTLRNNNTFIVFRFQLIKANFQWYIFPFPSYTGLHEGNIWTEIGRCVWKDQVRFSVNSSKINQDLPSQENVPTNFRIDKENPGSFT